LSDTQLAGLADALPAALASFGLDAAARDGDGDHYRGHAVPAG